MKGDAWPLTTTFLHFSDFAVRSEKQSSFLTPRPRERNPSSLSPFILFPLFSSSCLRYSDDCIRVLLSLSHFLLFPLRHDSPAPDHRLHHPATSPPSSPVQVPSAPSHLFMKRSHVRYHVRYHIPRTEQCSEPKRGGKGVLGR